MDRLPRGFAVSVRWVRHLGFTRAEWSWIAVAGLTVAAGVVGFLGVSEDVVRHNGLSSSDRRRLQFVVEHRSAWLDRAAEMASKLGSAPFLTVAAVIVAAVLYRLGKPVLVAVAPGLALGAAGLIAEVWKVTVGRARPDAAFQLVSETAPSFPSGHSTDSAAFYLAVGIVVALFVVKRPWARITSVVAAQMVAALIGASRLVLGVHWPSDVIAGLLLGTVIATVAGAGCYLAIRATGTAGAARTGLAGLLFRIRAADRPDGPLLAVT